MNSYHEKNDFDKNAHHIKGVNCDVKNCVYHDGECDCTASRISVGPSYASSSTDTVCATFKQKGL